MELNEAKVLFVVWLRTLTFKCLLKFMSFVFWFQFKNLIVKFPLIFYDWLVHINWKSLFLIFQCLNFNFLKCLFYLYLLFSFILIFDIQIIFLHNFFTANLFYPHYLWLLISTWFLTFFITFSLFKFHLICLVTFEFI